jgi:hypothetical protein
VAPPNLVLLFAARPLDWAGGGLRFVRRLLHRGAWFPLPEGDGQGPSGGRVALSPKIPPELEHSLPPFCQNGSPAPFALSPMEFRDSSFHSPSAAYPPQEDSSFSSFGLLEPGHFEDRPFYPRLIGAANTRFAPSLRPLGQPIPESRPLPVRTTDDPAQGQVFPPSVRASLLF